MAPSDPLPANRSKPRLPLKVLLAIMDTEQTVKPLLDTCVSGLFGPFAFLESSLPKVIDVMSAGVIEAFRLRAEFYSSSPGFCPVWLDEAAEETIDAIMELAPVAFLFTSAYRKKRPEIYGALSVALQPSVLEWSDRGAQNRSRSVVPSRDELPQEQVEKRPGLPSDYKAARALKVATLIKELSILRPQMFEDEKEYNELRAKYPSFHTFAIADLRPDLKKKILCIGHSRRHTRLAQELAGAHFNLQLSTIKTDWKLHKPAAFKRPS